MHLMDNEGHGSAVQFRYISAIGLRLKTNKVPNVSLHMKYKGSHGPVKIVSQHSQGSNPEWNENTTKLLLPPSTDVTFVVKHSSIVWASNEIARSRTYTIEELVNMQEDPEDWQTGFVLPLKLCDPDVKSTASLRIAIRTYMSVDERKIWMRGVSDSWRNTNQEHLRVAIISLERELSQLYHEAPADLKTSIDIISGLLLIVKPFLSHPQIHEDRTVVVLFEAFARGLQAQNNLQQKSVAAQASSDASAGIGHNGRVFVEIIIGLRLLERYGRDPSPNNPLKSSIANCSNTSISSKSGPVTSDISTTDIFKFRAVTRYNFLASNPVFRDVGAIVDMDPLPQAYGTYDHRAPEVVQKIALWAVSFAHSERKRLLWLHGSENCGRNQTVHSLIDSFTTLGFLGAYFSFRSFPRHGSADATCCLGSLPATLALQMAAYRPDMANPICDALQRSPDILTKDISLQLVYLFMETSQKAANMTNDANDVPKPMLVVLDDLDQCDPHELKILMKLLRSGLKRFPSFVRILLISSDLPDVRCHLQDNDSVCIQGFYDLVDENDSSAETAHHRQSSIKWSQATVEGERPLSMENARTNSDPVPNTLKLRNTDFDIIEVHR